MTLDPPARTLKLSKFDAAHRQTRAAVAAFAKGDFDIAVTLAGAAEDCLPDPPPGHPIPLLKDLPAGIEGAGGRKQWIRVINDARNWLKHETIGASEMLEVQRSDAAIMICRAIVKLQVTRAFDDALLDEFRLWLMEHLDALDGHHASGLGAGQ